MPSRMAKHPLAIIAPGLLIAATGVGAGDLLTASIAGSRVGLAVVVAAIVGAGLKWTLNEGIARWQMATGTTLLAGWVAHLPRVVQAIFAVYFVLWTVMVGGALVNACGVAGAALVPLGSPVVSKVIWGIVHALAGLVIVRVGGFRGFERVMSGCVILLFAGVVVTAAFVAPAWPDIQAAIVSPRRVLDDLPWTLAVLGGVGGTVTLLSYGYWIQGADRNGIAGLRTCRIDLATAYGMTALFGMSMVIIGSRIRVDGQGAGLALVLAEQLGNVLGPAGRWAFLLGFWSAVFSSLLGVWQSAPAMFADFFVYGRYRKVGAPLSPSELPRTRAYRAYLVFTALGAVPLLWTSVARAQLAYAILGALFMPFLALTLLGLNTRTSLVGKMFVNGWAANIALAGIVVLFLVLGSLQLAGRMPPFGG